MREVFLEESVIFKMREIMAHLHADRNDPVKGNTDEAGRRMENCWSDGVKCRSKGVGLI